MWSQRVLSVLARRRHEWIHEKRKRRRSLTAAYSHGRKKRRETQRHDREK
jgi:hypothetical protein